MEEEQPRLLVEHMTMYRRHLDAVRAQRRDDGVHFVAGEHEIAGDRGLAIAGRLKADRRREPQWSDGSHCHSVVGDRIAAWHAELIDAAIGLSFDADDLIELRGVGVYGGRGSWSPPRRPRGLTFGPARSA